MVVVAICVGDYMPVHKPVKFRITHESYDKKNIKEVELSPGEYHIGRFNDPRNPFEPMLVIRDNAGNILHHLGKTDDYVSRKHLKLYVGEDGKVEIEDVSTNGTLVRTGGMEMHQATTIGEMKEKIQIGPSAVGFYPGVNNIKRLVELKPSLLTIKKVKKKLDI